VLLLLLSVSPAFHLDPWSAARSAPPIAFVRSSGLSHGISIRRMELGQGIGPVGGANLAASAWDIGVGNILELLLGNALR
jgi:hypothetical protein